MLWNTEIDKTLLHSLLDNSCSLLYSETSRQSCSNVSTLLVCWSKCWGFFFVIKLSCFIRYFKAWGL